MNSEVICPSCQESVPEKSLVHRADVTVCSSCNDKYEEFLSELVENHVSVVETYVSTKEIEHERA